MNPAPSLQGSLWSGNQQLATKRQLISSISGLYNDIQDIELSTIKVTNLNVSTLTAQQWISTPELYVSSIVGGGLQVNDGFLQISTGNISLVSLSTLQFKGIDLGGVEFNFDLGLGNAIGGFLGGLGALVGGVFIGLGTGTGLAIQGITNGLFSLANTRGDSLTNINSNVFETINGTTQLQISTLGNAFPYYSSIYRSVSSISPNSVPGQEIFLSTIFPAGTTCVRSVSDPIPVLTNNSTINTSTIQSFGEWVPFLDPSVTSEDIYARKAQFSSLTLINTNTTDYPIFMNMSNTNGLEQILSLIDTPYDTLSLNVPYSDGAVAGSQLEIIYKNRVNFNRTLDFISTPYTQYTSTIGNYVGGVYFLESSITNQTTIPKFIYNGAILGGGNFAVCEPDETGFLSTGTMDFVAQSSNIFLQWGLAVNNLNSTIAVGTSKRVSWDIPGNTSNFIDIPVPQSTISGFELATLYLEQHPYESRWFGQYTGDGLYNPQGGMAFAMKTMTFGDITTFNNQPNYPYQFNGNVYVDGAIEADLIIALSSFTSTNVVTYFSTFLLEADEAFIDYCQVSTLYSTDLIGANSISTFGIENYSHLSQFSFVSTLVVDLQILEGTTGGTTATLNKIQGNTAGSFVKNYTLGSFSNLSSINHSTGNLFANSANISNININTLSASNGSFSNLTTSNVFNGNTLFGQFLTLSTTTTSTINVNTISTTSHTGSDITCDNITINDFATFPSVANGSNIISMTFSNSTNSNSYTPLQATLIQGSVFPQSSNVFSITTSGSNTTFQDRQGFVFDTNVGDTFTFGAGIENVNVTDGDLYVRSVKYGTNASGYLQPRAFAMSNTTGFGAGTTITASGAVTDGTNNFLGSDYNCLIGLRSFAQTNGAVAYNSVIVVPYIDATTQNWYWSLQADINVGSAGGDGIFSWNVFLFPYNMVT